MEGQKSIVVYAIVALIVGAVIGVGVGSLIFNGDEEYGFYLYFADNDDRNGWYTATAGDATTAFEKAMDDAGFEYEYSDWGYIASIDDEDGGGSGWYTAMYLYSETTETAAQASVNYAYSPYGYLQSSNGWIAISGYDTDSEDVELKFYQMNSNYYFLSPYKSDWTATSPDMVNDWMTTGPFAA